MAWNYDFPYINSQQLNDDWLLKYAQDLGRQMEQVEALITEFKSQYAVDRATLIGEIEAKIKEIDEKIEYFDLAISTTIKDASDKLAVDVNAYKAELKTASDTYKAELLTASTNYKAELNALTEQSVKDLESYKTTVRGDMLESVGKVDTAVENALTTIDAKVTAFPFEKLYTKVSGNDDTIALASDNTFLAALYRGWAIGTDNGLEVVNSELSILIGNYSNTGAYIPNTLMTASQMSEINESLAQRAYAFGWTGIVDALTINFSDNKICAQPMYVSSAYNGITGHLIDTVLDTNMSGATYTDFLGGDNAQLLTQYNDWKSVGGASATLIRLRLA